MKQSRVIKRTAIALAVSAVFLLTACGGGGGGGGTSWPLTQTDVLTVQCVFRNAQKMPFSPKMMFQKTKKNLPKSTLNWLNFGNHLLNPKNPCPVRPNGPVSPTNYSISSAIDPKIVTCYNNCMTNYS